MMIVNVIFGTNNGVAEATAPEAGALAYAEKETDPRCETAIVRTTCHCHLSNAVPSSYPSHKSQSP